MERNLTARRAAQGLPRPPPDASPAKYWQEVWDAPVGNRVKVFAVRLAHAALPCRAMRSALVAPHDEAACQHCSLHPAASPPPVETYTHLFLHCPAYRAAVEWLADVWAAVSGGTRPPLDARVIVADEPGAWPGAPADGMRPLWHALRLTVLFCIWEARCSAFPEARTAAVAVRAAVAMLRADIRHHYVRAREREWACRQLPPRVVSMRRGQPDPESFAVWVAAGLARVAPPPAGSHAGPTLEVLLSETFPVPAPAPPAGAAGGAATAVGLLTWR